MKYKLDKKCETLILKAETQSDIFEMGRITTKINCELISFWTFKSKKPAKLHISMNKIYSLLMNMKKANGTNFHDLPDEKEFDNAVKVVTEGIKSDEELYISYQSNLAMAFKDEYDRNNKKYKNRQDIHEIANTAAKNFLNLWIVQ